MCNDVQQWLCSMPWSNEYAAKNFDCIYIPFFIFFRSGVKINHFISGRGGTPTSQQSIPDQHTAISS
jgi:hypothetical protein